MKRFTVLLFVSITAQVFAQQYFPLPSNAVWTVGFSGFFGFPRQGDFTRVYFDGDTAISSITYKKVYTSRFIADTLWNTDYVGAIRGENERWFFIDSLHTEEKLLYDFGVSVGDTLSVHDMVFPVLHDTLVLHVIGVDSILIDGTYRKKITVSPRALSTSWNDDWIEGIGSVRGLLYAHDCWGYDCGAALECYEENERVLYHNSIFGYHNCQNPVSVRELAQPNLEVYPVPSQTEVFMNPGFELTGKERVFIFSVTGTEMKDFSVRLNNVPVAIDISGLPGGAYFIHLTDENGRVRVGKIISKSAD